MRVGSVIARGAIVVATLVALAAEASVAVRWLASDRPLVGASFGTRGTEPAHFVALLDRVGQGGTKLSAPDTARINEVAVAEPLSPVPYVLVGAARGGKAGARLVEMGEQRDPRFQPGLTWALGDALARKDPAGEARALVRLLALRRHDDRLYPALAALAAAPPALAVIKAAIARNPAWRGDFLLSVNGVADPAIAFQLNQAGAPVASPASATAPAPGASAAPTADTNNRQSLLLQLVSHGEYDRAYLAWVQWLADEARPGLGLVFDGGFKHYAALLPFNWDLPSETGAATFAADGGLSVDYSGTDPVLLARQVLVLPPGRYRLVAKAKFDAAAGGSDAAIGWTLECRGGGPLTTLPLALGGNGAPVGSAAFVVSDSCPAQILSLAVPAVEFAGRVSGTVQSVAVERVAP